MVGYRRRRRSLRRRRRRRSTRSRRYSRRRNYRRGRSYLSTFETKGQIYDLTSFFTSTLSTWDVHQIMLPNSDLANAGAVEGREFYPTLIYSKNATIAGGQGPSVPDVQSDDSYNLYRIVIFSTTQATVSASALSNVRLDTPFSTRLPFTTNPSIEGLRVHYDKLHRLLPHLAYANDELTATLYPVNIFIKLPRIKHYKNPNGNWNRTYWMAARSDSSAPPSPGFVSGTLTCLWKDP